MGKARESYQIPCPFEDRTCLRRHTSQRAGDVILRTIGISMAEVKLGLRNIAYNMDRFCTLMLQNAQNWGVYRKNHTKCWLFQSWRLEKESLQSYFSTLKNLIRRFSDKNKCNFCQKCIDRGSLNRSKCDVWSFYYILYFFFFAILDTGFCDIQMY